MQIGYIRVSTNDQNTDLQRNALNCAGCELIFEDKISGTKSAKNRREPSPNAGGEERRKSPKGFKKNHSGVDWF